MLILSLSKKQFPINSKNVYNALTSIHEIVNTFKTRGTTILFLYDIYKYKTSSITKKHFNQTKYCKYLQAKHKKKVFEIKEDTFVQNCCFHRNSNSLFGRMSNKIIQLLELN